MNQQQLSPYMQFSHEYEAREAVFAGNLPAHIPAERFKRVVLRAVQKNPDLLVADRASLFNAAMDAATDGLLPDGREGAMVVYNTKVKREGKEVWIKKVQWMPMIAGLLKKVRNSGELKSIAVRLVYAGDIFKYWIDEHGEHLNYEAADAPDKNIFRRAFAMAVTNDGGVYIEVMDADDIEKVRNASKSKDKAGAPWVEWWEEMVKKSVLRRLTKRLPMSTDLDDLIRRDDALYDLEAASDRRQIEPAKSLSGRLDQLADQRGVGVVDTVRHDADGVVIEQETVEPDTRRQAEGGATSGNVEEAGSGAAQQNGNGDRSPSPEADAKAPAGSANSSPAGAAPTLAEARAAGVEARTKNRARKAIPKKFAEAALREAYLDGFDNGDQPEPGSFEEDDGDGMADLMDQEG